MSCCNETKYNLFLKLTPEQKIDIPFQTDLRNNLQSAMSWSLEQANQAVNWAVKNETFLISKDSIDRLTQLSLKLAKYSIPHNLKLSK